MAEYNLELLKKHMKEELTADRYEHTLGVMYTAEALAMRYGADMTKAAVAGLLHDCAKCIPNAQKLKMCKKHHIEICKHSKAIRHQDKVRRQDWINRLFITKKHEHHAHINQSKQHICNAERRENITRKTI